jgi:hypothetical protein
MELGGVTGHDSVNGAPQKLEYDRRFFRQTPKLSRFVFKFHVRTL